MDCEDDGRLFAEGCSPDTEQATGKAIRVELLEALLAADLTANEAADILYGVARTSQGKVPHWRSASQYAEMTQALERMLFRAGFTLR